MGDRRSATMTLLEARLELARATGAFDQVAGACERLSFGRPWFDRIERACAVHGDERREST